MISAAMRAGSVSEAGVKIATLEVTMPRNLLAQFNTHRMFSRNAASSRAVPVNRLIDATVAHPFIPVLTVAGKGMTAPGVVDDVTQQEWVEDVGELLEHAARLCSKWATRGHKQHVNRYLEPWSWVTVLVTATDWDNFFRLRLHHAAQPEMQQVAQEMHRAMDEYPDWQTLKPGQWHMPFGEMCPEGATMHQRLKLATARCARLSYNQHDGTYSPTADYTLHDKLYSDGHYSPFEHCTKASAYEDMRYSNLTGWISYRYHIEKGLSIQ